MKHTDSLVEHLLKTSVAQTWVTYIFLILWSHVVQMHLFAFLCQLFRVNPIIDFCVDVCLSLALQDILRVISWAIVDKYRFVFERMLRPLFYSPPRKRRYIKTIVFGCITLYVIAAVQLCGVNENFLTIVASQVFVCHVLRVFIVSDTTRRYFTHRIEFLAFRICPNTEGEIKTSSINTTHFQKEEEKERSKNQWQRIKSITTQQEWRIVDSGPSLRKRARDSTVRNLKRMRRKLMNISW